MDHQGNTVNSHLSCDSKEFAHTVAVNEVDIDSKGEYVITCSDDGRVNIIGLFSDEQNQTISFGHSIRSVVLDPDPKVSEGKRFIVGKLLNFINKRNDDYNPNVLFQGMKNLLCMKKIFSKN